MKREDVERAIATIEFSRRTHVEWADYLEANPEAAREPQPQEDIAGSVKHHRDCIEGYDHVLAVLRSFKEAA
jgi:hypothetical protein